MKVTFGLSVSGWRLDDTASVTQGICRIGVRNFEIGSTADEAYMDEVFRMVERGEIEVSSVHNVCVREKVLPQEIMGEGLSSLDEEARERTVGLTVKTVENARNLGARAVVIHAGSVDILGLKTFQGEHFARVEKTGLTKEVSRLLTQKIEERNRAREPYLNAASRSLKEIIDRTEDVILGLESRYSFYEIPSFEEVAILMERVGSERLRYWHDVGHCAVQEVVGVSRQVDWLDRYSRYLAGIHIHDVLGFKDHLLPGKGNLPLGEILAKVPPEAIRVVEVPPGVPLEELARCFQMLKDMEALHGAKGDV